MAEVLLTFTTPTKAENGDLYYARAVGRQRRGGTWESWIEFELAGSDEHVMTERESEQSSRDDLMYWAQGLSSTYLEGALERALHPTLASDPGRELAPEAAPQTSREERRNA